MKNILLRLWMVVIIVLAMPITGIFGIYWLVRWIITGKEFPPPPAHQYIGSILDTIEKNTKAQTQKLNQ